MQKIILMTLGITVSLFLWGQVDEPELDSVDYSSVEFRNYEGPHQRIDTLAEIRGIGLSLSRWDEEGEGRYFNKYRLLHLIDPKETGRFDGDILFLDEAAGVDHIDNLRHILGGYLEEAYGYPREDADLLARFITYYNAVYRGREDIFFERYTALVNKFLTPGKIGLSTHYEEWPGNSELVIPLTGRQGVGALETDALTDSEVVESLREREDRGIDERKAITELKEEELQEEEEAIEEERRALEERKADLEEAQQDLAQGEEDRTSGEVAETLEDRKEDLAEEERTLEEDLQVLEEREAKQEDRLELIRQEREQIAEDERELLGAPSEQYLPEDSEGIPFMTFSLDRGERLGRLILAEAATGNMLTQSSLNNVRTPTFTPFSGGYLLIAGEDSGNRIVSLVMLDRETLKVVKTASERVSKTGGIFLHGDSVYTVIERDGRWVPGRFDKDLNLTGFLSEEVAEYSFLGFNEGYILYQKNRGQVGSTLLSDFSLP